MVDCHLKPFDIEELLDCVGKYALNVSIPEVWHTAGVIAPPRSRGPLPISRPRKEH
jgi:hypothetical protein